MENAAARLLQVAAGRCTEKRCMTVENLHLTDVVQPFSTPRQAQCNHADRGLLRFAAAANARLKRSGTIINLETGTGRVLAVCLQLARSILPQMTMRQGLGFRGSAKYSRGLMRRLAAMRNSILSATLHHNPRSWFVTYMPPCSTPGCEMLYVLQDPWISCQPFKPGLWITGDVGLVRSRGLCED